MYKILNIKLQNKSPYGIYSELAISNLSVRTHALESAAGNCLSLFSFK